MCLCACVLIVIHYVCFLVLIEHIVCATGVEYTVGRIPMASCDFSTRAYSYDDFPGDLNLTHFSLAKEDIMYKVQRQDK
jgi:glucosylceramidase